MKKINLNLLILATFASSMVAGAASLYDDFESYNVGTNLSALSAKGWGASDAGAIVTNNMFGNPTNMALLPPSVVVTNTLPSGLSGKVWTDCLVDETMRVIPAYLPFIESNTVVMAGVTTDGFAVVYNKNSNGWDTCTTDARGSSVSGVVAGAWARLSLCEDFSTHKVALFMDGRLLRQEIPFITNRSSYVKLSFSSGVASTGVVDEVYVNTNIPSTLTNLALSTTNDINGDGVYDAVEIVGYGKISKVVPLDYATITGALAAAQAGDRVVVSNGAYAGPVALSNGILLVGATMAANATNLQVDGTLSVAQTGIVSVAGGIFTVTGQVTVAAGGLLVVSNAASFGGFATGAGGKVQVVGGTLAIGGITNGPGTYWTVTNIVNSAGNGTITPNGTNTMLSSWQDVTYVLTANVAYVVGALTNNGMDVGGALVGAGTKTATYTNSISNITNNQIITAAFSYTGIRYVPGDYTTISNALAAALANERIVVSNGAYAESLVVSNNVTLVGTNVTGVTSLTVLSNKTAVLSGFTTFEVTSLVIQSNAMVVVSNSTLTVNGVTYSGTFRLDSGFNGELTRSMLNFTNDFEMYATNMPLALCGGQGWGASASGSIVQGLVFTNGNKAAKVVAQSLLSNVVAGVIAQSNVWTDVWLNDSAIKYEGTPYPGVDSGLAVMLFVNTNDHVVIRNAGVWDECLKDVAGNAAPVVTTGQWARLTVYQDFVTTNVALFVNGQLVRQMVPFLSTVNKYQGFSLSSGAGASYLDDVKIWTSLPTGLTNGPLSDLDHDGIADAIEIQRYGDVSAYPRGSVFKVR